LLAKQLIQIRQRATFIMCHVLIIEDHPMIAMLLQDALEDEGATSFAFAATQKDAVDLARQNRPAFITSDVNLLEGTGPAAVAAIHAELGEVPVLFITATPDQCQPCAPPGVVLLKPVNVRHVAKAFHELVAH
jgi:CheY-like chemotaxis protein